MSFSALTGTPLVSVLIANYNYAKYIGEAIESVQTQTYQGYELVICDDGSSDDSCKVIESYAAKDPKIVLIRKNNGGQASALNRAFLESKGDVISILDADDAFESMKLAKVVEAFKESPQAGIAIHDLMVVDGDGRKRYVAHYKQSGYLGPEIPTLRMGLPMPQASGLSFRREVLKEILPLPEDRFRSVADWAVAYVAAYLTNTTRVPEVLARYRIHANNLSGTTSTASD
jgi:glycosyltransferase involved in cell wall biosynthesis